MELVIAEKPSVGRDLARVLGVRGKGGDGDWLENDRFAITWCIGHLVELDEPASYDDAWKPWRLERLPMLPERFRLRPSQHAKGQLRTVSKLLKDKRFTGVINACDAGREGELIFRYVYQYAKSKLPVRRLWISSLTDDAIRRGFGALRPGKDYDALAAAAYSRSEADWLVGMNATRAVTTKSRTGRDSDQLYSIGRVQTPTLALMVRREDEIRAFVPKPYWEVRGDFRTADGATFQAPWRHGKLLRIASAEIAEQVVARDREHGAIASPGLAGARSGAEGGAESIASPGLAGARSGAEGGADGQGPRVVGLTSKTVREAPPQLFDLTSLQRTANRRFGFSAARTLEIAQALYERHKLVTYPRTDSRHLSTDVAKQLPELFQSLTAIEEYSPFARKLVEHPPRPSGRIVDDSKVSDHHAIIPTGGVPRGALERDEGRLFDLIVRRFLGAFYPDAEIAVTEAWIRVGAGDGPAPPLAAADRDTFVDALPPPPDHYLARGRVRLVAGWQEVAGIDGERRSRDDGKDDKDDEATTSSLPALAVGQHLAGAFSTLAKQTTPPPRHSEATLLAAMESAGKQIEDEALRAAMKDVGLGTPATRAAIIETLLRRRYIVREKQHLVPTPTGIGLLRTLVAAKVATLASPELTGSWEARLARVARGEEARVAFMADIARYVREVIDAIRGASSSDLPTPPPPPPGGPSGPPAKGGRNAPKPRARSGAPKAKRAASTSTASGGAPRGNAAAPTARGAAPRPNAAAPNASGAAPRPNAAAPTASGGAPRPLAAAATARGTAPRPSADAATARGTAPRPNAAAPATGAVPRPSSAAVPKGVACPQCKQGTVIAGNRGWGCSRWREGCRFVIWFERAARDLSPAQLQAAIAAQP